MTLTPCIAALIAAAGIAHADTETPTGAPVGHAATAPVDTPVHTPGMTDAGLPIAAADSAPRMLTNTPTAESEQSTQPRGTYTGAGPLPAPSTLDVELGANPSAAAIGLAVQAENAWARGDAAAAQAALDAIERMGELVAGTYAYDQPQAVGGRAFGEAVIKAGVNAETAEFNFDPATGNLFAVVDGGGVWSLHISTDNGNTWAQTFTFNDDARHLDLAIVNNFVYVGYNVDSATTQARLRRFSTANGSVDAVYGFQTVFTDPLGQPIVDLAVETNVDTFNNRIFYAIIQDDNTVRWAFDNSTDGTTFAENSNNGVTDAASNLDMHWDTITGDVSLHLNYVSTTNQIRHIGFTSSSWTMLNAFVANYTNGPVRLAAEQDTVIVSYIADNTGNPGTNSVEYHISYNDGVSFAVGGLNSQGVATNKFSPDVAARLGYGTAITYNSEAGAFDPAIVRRRAGYAPGGWGNEQTVNVTDLRSGGLQRIEALPTISSGAPASYGVLFETQLNGGELRFTRIENCSWLGDVDNDGDVELDDLLAVLANFGTFNPVGDTDGNGFVDLNDLLTVLADFGNNCSQI